MSDPFLDAHREAPLAYAITGFPVLSLRDQVLYGSTLVHRLIEAQEIDSSRSFLVVGATISGVAAAIEAAAQRIKTILIEPTDSPFATLKISSQQSFDATESEWPLGPASEPPWLPLSLKTTTGARLSAYLNVQLNKALDTYHDLSLVLRSRVLKGTPSQGMLTISLNDGRSLSVGALLVTRDLTDENCRIADATGRLLYEGEPTWGPHDLTKLDPARHNVLISGSGEAAVRDYLRIVTHINSLSEISRNCYLPQDLLLQVERAGEHANRGRSWASNTDVRFGQAQEAPFLRALDEFYATAVDRALHHPLVRQGLHKLLPKAPVPVTLIYREASLQNRNGLRRFLTFLLSKYVEREFGHRTLYPRCDIAHIRPSPPDHACLGPTPLGPSRASGSYVGTWLVRHDCFERNHEAAFSGPHGPSHVI